jgi:hypothetical protein
MSSLINDPNHWRGCAKEARLLASHVTDARTKETLLSIAASYDNVAKQAEERTAAVDRPARAM